MKKIILGNTSETLKDRTFKVINKLDIITTIPYSWMLYSHVGQTIYVNRADQIVKPSSADHAKWRDGFMQTSYKYLFPDQQEINVYRRNSSELVKDFTDWNGNFHSNLVIRQGNTFNRWQNFYVKTKVYRNVFPFNVILQLVVFALVPVLATSSAIYYLVVAGGAHGRESYGKEILTTQTRDAFPNEPISFLTQLIFSATAIVLGPALVALIAYAVYKATIWSIQPLLDFLSG